MSQRYAPTIRDVAKRASVSPATVSLVIRKLGTVRPQTTRRVWDAIEALNYRPKPTGRPKSLVESFNIAIAYPGAAAHLAGNLTASATGRWFEAIRRELQQRGHHLSYFGSMPVEQVDALFKQVVRKGEIDGVIFLGDAAMPAYITWTAQQAVPVVVVNRRPEHEAFSYVEIDNQGGGRAAADYLLQRHHRQIGLIRTHRPRGYNQRRYQGFLQQLQSQKLKPTLFDAPPPEPARQDPAYYRKLSEQVIQAGVSAVFCDGDGVARECLNAWHDMGVDLPGELSVIGFDDTGVVSRKGVGLTSVSFDVQAVGCHVADMIARLIHERSRLVQLTATLGTHISERHSVASLTAPTKEPAR